MRILKTLTTNSVASSSRTYRGRERPGLANRRLIKGSKTYRFELFDECSGILVSANMTRHGTEQLLLLRAEVLNDGLGSKWRNLLVDDVLCREKTRRLARVKRVGNPRRSKATQA